MKMESVLMELLLCRYFLAYRPDPSKPFWTMLHLKLGRKLLQRVKLVKHISRPRGVSVMMVWSLRGWMETQGAGVSLLLCKYYMQHIFLVYTDIYK